MRFADFVLCVCVAGLLAGCRRGEEGSDASQAVTPPEALASFREKGPIGGVAVRYPRDGIVFPRELPAPTFEWDSSAAGAGPWVAALFLGDSNIVAAVTQGTRWQVDEVAWNRIRQDAGVTQALFAAIGLSAADGRTVRASAGVRLRMASEPVGAPIFCRDVPLPFVYAVKNPDTICWRLINVGSAQEPPVVLRNLPVCGNCHSFDAAGRTLGMDVDYANDKGSYAVTDLAADTVLSPDRILTWSDYRRGDGDSTFGLLSRVSPDGRYVISTVKDRSVFVPRPDLAYSQLFFPVKGILAFYDRTTKTFASLPGADDPRFVQSNAEWSSDGEWVYFCRAPADAIREEKENRDVLLTHHLARDFVEKKRGFRFDIWRVRFRGGQGGTPEPVRGASGNGRSNYFPKLSPDGRWLAFCRSDNFMLLQPDSRLFLVPAEGGEPREMACNTGAMNSWHSWSPNGRWLVFSTKERGPYTQLCLAHVDAEGRDAPAVRLEKAAIPKRACNIPEFVNIRPEQRLVLRERFLDSNNFRRQGLVLLLAGDISDSILLFRKAVSLNPDDHDARLKLALACTELGRREEGRREFETILARVAGGRTEAERDMAYAAHAHMAVHARQAQDLDGAVKHYRKCIEYKPRDVEARLFLGLLHAMRRQFVEARDALDEVLTIEPGNALAHLWMGQVLADSGQAERAEEHDRSALAATPARKEDWLLIANRLSGRREMAAGLESFVRRYNAAYPDSAEGHVVMAKMRLHAGDTKTAISEFEQARQKDPSQDWIAEKIAELRGRP
jgi:tetratricopeptide (TPR) repeat protein